MITLMTESYQHTTDLENIVYTNGNEFGPNSLSAIIKLLDQKALQTIKFKS
jgi:hypothetical protein